MYIGIVNTRSTDTQEGCAIIRVLLDIIFFFSSVRRKEIATTKNMRFFEKRARKYTSINVWSRLMHITLYLATALVFANISRQYERRKKIYDSHKINFHKDIMRNGKSIYRVYSTHNRFVAEVRQFWFMIKKFMNSSALGKIAAKIYKPKCKGPFRRRYILTISLCYDFMNMNSSS